MFLAQDLSGFIYYIMYGVEGSHFLKGILDYLFRFDVGSIDILAVCVFLRQSSNNSIHSDNLASAAFYRR